VTGDTTRLGRPPQRPKFASASETPLLDQVEDAVVSRS
jgi:hypothetical protein